MVSLTQDPELLNNLLLHIDIELVDWNPDMAKRFGFRKGLKFNDIVDNPSHYTINRKYRKTIHLGTYNELGTLL